MIRIAVLGFGKVGQKVLETVQNDTQFKERFSISAIWNRTPNIFSEFDLPNEIKIYKSLESLIQNLDDIDLLIECAHPSIVQQYAEDIIQQTDFYISSPTAFSDRRFRQQFIQQIEQANQHCYIPLGASLGLWDVIRLDQDNQLKSLRVVMTKEPDSYKINDPDVLKNIEEARNAPSPVLLAKGPISVMNLLAPQNTNTMSIYALAAGSLGFEQCEGELIGDRRLTAHMIELHVETKSGLKLSLTRNNPANPGQVTGSATFGSFLNSLYHYKEGIAHNHFIFC